MLEDADADITEHISPTHGFRYARFSRVISQSNHGLYCESSRYNKVFGRGSSWMTRNLSETLATAASVFISGGGKRKLWRAVHSVTIRSSSVLYICCLNPDITADNVSLSDGDDDDDDDHDGERIIGRYVLCVKYYKYNSIYSRSRGAEFQQSHVSALRRFCSR